MGRFLRDDLDHCIKHKKCLDCHRENQDQAAIISQIRRKSQIPSCRRHFNAYKSKINEPNAKKYARYSAARRLAHECSYKGCRHKLIPKELLLSRIDEKTCGMHVAFKDSRVNRAAILRFIVANCLSPEELLMSAQNIVYKPGQPFIWFSVIQAPGIYITKYFAAKALVEGMRTASLRLGCPTP